VTGLLDAAALELPSEEAWARGIRILQGNRLGDTDAAHVAALLALMALPEGALIADIGCGFGEVARLMRGQRPSTTCCSGTSPPWGGGSCGSARRDWDAIGFSRQLSRW
jgi:hypothetical protein